MHCFPSSPPRPPGTRNPVLDETLHIQQALHKARGHLFWGCINVLVLSLFLYDLLKKSSHSNRDYLFYQVEILLALIFGINSFFHFVKYFFETNNLQPVCLSPTQKKLLGVKSSDPYFKTLSPDKLDEKENSTVKTETDFNSSPLTGRTVPRLIFPSLLNESVSSSHSYSVPAHTWMYQKKGSSPNILKPALHPVSTVEDFITGEQSLNKYIQDYEEHEKKASVSTSMEESSNSFSFWNTSNSKALNEVSPVLRRCMYQLSPITPVSNSPGANTEESTSPSAIQQNQELWRRFKVDPTKLVQWNANLRMWISQTVLQRLVKEFDRVDEAFQKCGLSDMRLGLVGLDSLKKTAGIPQIAASIPSLPRLVHFLEITPHQEYLVARIRELAKGGSISEYRWDSGGTLNGKNWEEHLPTDAAVVMHLIATYLDSQILFLPHHTDGRPFTTNHFVRSPEKPKVQNALIIYQVQLNPPHFVLLENNNRLEMAKGRNNLFHTFLLFLHILKTKEHGMLGRVNLGSSGVNILWVIDD